MSLDALLYAWLVPTGLAVGIVGIAGTIFKKVARRGRIARWLALAWALALALAWVLRIESSGHLPIFGTYESALSLALAVMITAIIWEVSGKARVVMTPLATLTAAALLTQGVRFDSASYALTISERSWVVEVHAVVAWFAFGVLAVNSFVALRLLIGRGDSPTGASRWLVISLQLGFLLHTGMLVSGSIYKFLLFGTPWSFDPIETLGIVSWMAYGTLLHLHLLAGWSGRRLAGWCLSVFVLLVVSYRCIVYFPPWSSYHILDMDRRIHLGAEDLGSGGGEP